MLSCGRIKFRIWFAHGGFYMKMRCPSSLSRAPPRWVIGTGQLGRLRFRAGPIARRGGGGIMPFSIFVVSGRAWVLYGRVDMSNILSCLVVDRPRPEYGLPVAVIRKDRIKVPTTEPTAGDGFWPDTSPVGGGIVLFSIFVVASDLAMILMRRTLNRLYFFKSF